MESLKAFVLVGGKALVETLGLWLPPLPYPPFIFILILSYSCPLSLHISSFHLIPFSSLSLCFHHLSSLSLILIPYPYAELPSFEDLLLREEPLLRLRRWQPDAVSSAPRLREALDSDSVGSWETSKHVTKPHFIFVSMSNGSGE